MIKLLRGLFRDRETFQCERLDDNGNVVVRAKITKRGEPITADDIAWLEEQADIVLRRPS